MSTLTVRLGNSLQLVLLLDGVRSRRALGGVDQLLGQALGNGLDVSERSLSGTDGQQGNGGVDSSQWRDIDSLSSDSTGRTDSGGVLSGTRVDNSIDNNLQWVLLGEHVDDLQGVLDDSDGLQLLTVVLTVHHQRVSQSLNDRALSLSESLRGVSTGSVGDEHRGSDLDVVDQGNVLHLNILKRPLVEQLDLLLGGLHVSWDRSGQLDQLQFLLHNWLLDLLLLFLDVRHFDSVGKKGRLRKLALRVCLT
ncbi:hypothetical protein METSCH_F01760 [Metschnikowia aff. pulcherrima]|uniref:Uncharacterized protein n=1 Tax=Metschnikowia aff. pulcherrima TaxID=2163413 RepID=A0A4P6XSN9_9ASCO|nr:hypothetical protein METSCH_F01760 [Metschnikowia aff. pulcherrima]